MDDPDVAGRAAFVSWLGDRISRDGEAAPETLWHYTDSGGLKGILSSNRVWATNALFLNDSREMSHGIGMARDALAAHRPAGLKSGTVEFLEHLSDPVERVIEGFLARTASIFVACFCSDGDLLSQWRGYASQGSSDGYAIGFSPPGNLFAWAQSAPGGHQLALRKVQYDIVHQQREVEELVERMVPILDASPGDGAHQRSFAKHLVNGVVEVAASFKDPAFREEREWRVIYVRTIDPDPLKLEHRNGNGLVVPYVQLHLPRAVGYRHEALPIRQIRCGPAPEPKLKTQGVESLLSTDLNWESVGVVGSGVPLRW